MSAQYDRVMSAIRSGTPFLIDGATGTEVERRGVPKIAHAWNAGGSLSHPRTVRAIHEDYIREGAGLVISNTFGTHRSALEDAGVADQFDAYNRRSVELACEARDHLKASHVLVAGGISHCRFTDRRPAMAALRANASEQAAIMTDAGADLLMLEMMMDIDDMVAVLDGALTSGLPVWLGFSCDVNESGNVTLLLGEPLDEAIAAIGEREVHLLNIMHTDVSVVDQCLDVVNAQWDRPIGVYAHSGAYKDGDWVFDDVIASADYVGACRAVACP